MFESIVLGFFVFALGYVGLLRLMARRADVLYGEFILTPAAGPERGLAAVVARLYRGARSRVGR
ncbi:MAG: hypothetical protein ABW175_20365 [Bradyrhizobium sp.]